jgi:hypothetical protein
MRLLLDTHTLLWWLTENSSLPASARKLIANKNNDVLVSAASAWEIATKVRLGKLPIAVDLAHDFIAYPEQERFRDSGGERRSRHSSWLVARAVQGSVRSDADCSSVGGEFGHREQ